MNDCLGCHDCHDCQVGALCNQLKSDVLLLHSVENPGFSGLSGFLVFQGFIVSYIYSILHI